MTQVSPPRANSYRTVAQRHAYVRLGFTAFFSGKVAPNCSAQSGTPRRLYFIGYVVLLTRHEPKFVCTTVFASWVSGSGCGLPASRLLAS